MRAPRPRALLTASLVAALLAAGCSSDSGSDDAADGSVPADASSTTEAPAGEGEADADLATYAERGPYGVGAQALALEDGRRVLVWYPAVEGAGTEEPTDSFNIATFLSPQLQALVPDEVRSQVDYAYGSATGAEPDPSGGPYPIVLFSHGAAGFPEQSVDLTTHLASWGYVVAAPEHVERSLGGFLGTTAEGVPEAAGTDVLAETLDVVVAEGEGDDLLAGMVDPERVAASGHSAGAGDSYRLASEGEVELDAVIAYALGRGRDGAVLPEPGGVPTMVMLGEEDGIIEAETTREVYGTLPEPKVLVDIVEHGHLVFSDLCLIGAAQGGIIGLAEAIELPVPENLKGLGSDGCTEEFPPVTEAFPAIDALSVAFLRSHLDGGEGAEAAQDLIVDGPVEGLGEADVTVTVG